MDMIESIDIIFQNLCTNILQSNGDNSLIEKYIKDAQYTVLCYTITSDNIDLEIIKPRVFNKNCVLN